MVADNLLSMTEGFITPDLVTKFSGVLGQPSEKIQSGLKSVISTFIMGLVSKGSTTDGAQRLVNLVQKEGLDYPVIPTNDPNYLRKGNDVVNGVFGNNLSSVVTGLGASTGLNSSSITKMLSMIAPMVMGVFGSKIKREGLSASGVMGFLKQQKSSLAGFIPAGLSGIFIGKSSANFARKSSRADALYTAQLGTKRKNWGLIGILALLGIGIFWFLTHREVSEKAIGANTGVTRTIERENVRPVKATQAGATSFAVPGANLEELTNFLQSGSAAELPKRFRFDYLTFDIGSSDLAVHSSVELDTIASALKANPTAKGRIEGFTDNSGDANVNQQLSAERAVYIKDELISRGVEPERIEAVGRGDQSPLASNDTDAGRAQNRRIEFVITDL